MKKNILKRVFVFLGAALLSATGLVAGQGSQAANESLWEASRAGDTARITAALAQGADVNAKSRYDVTPLIFAAGNGRLDAVKLLLSRGADVNAQDTFYRARAADMAHRQRLHRRRGLPRAERLRCRRRPRGRRAEQQRGAGQGGAGRQGHASGAAVGDRHGRHDEAGVARPADQRRARQAAARDSAPAFAVDPAVLPKYVGTYRDAGSGLTMTVTLNDGTLMSQVTGQPAVRLVPSAEDVFRITEVNATLTFAGRGGLVESVDLVQGPATSASRA